MNNYKIGQNVLGKDIGKEKYPRDVFVYVQCPDCENCRFLRCVKKGQKNMTTLVCRECNIKRQKRTYKVNYIKG